MVGLNANAGVGTDVAAAQVARRTLGWDAERAAREVDAYRQWVCRYRPRALEDAATAG
jgi:glycerol-3-phosphate dehydrogenase